MGLLVSKTDASTGTVKPPFHDDDRSKATARTEASSIYARSSRSSATPPNGTATLQHGPMQHPQGWRGGPWSSSLSQNPRRSQSSESLDTSNGTSSFMVRRDSDPGAIKKKNNPRSMPMKCSPIRHNLSGWDIHESTDPSEDENVDYLVRMYDTRTWEMYLRITEARQKNAHQISCEEDSYYPTDSAVSSPPLVAKNRETTSEWEHLQHESSDCDGGHAMVFLFDFD